MIIRVVNKRSYFTKVQRRISEKKMLKDGFEVLPEIKTKKHVKIQYNLACILMNLTFLLQTLRIVTNTLNKCQFFFNATSRIYIIGLTMVY